MDAAWLLVVAVVAGGVGAGVALWVKAAQGRQPASSPSDPFTSRVNAPTEHDLRELRVGDVVAIGGKELVVRGSLRFDEDGFRWDEHLLDDAAGTRRWLSVEDDEGLECVLWERLEGTALQPDGPEVEHEAVAYRQDERGSAHYQAEGTTGTGAAGESDFVDYVAPGGRRLSFERYGGTDWEVSRGEVVSPSSITVWPAGRS